MKPIHFFAILVIIAMVVFYQIDEYDIYSHDGLRIKSYESENIVRTYVKDQSMIQVVHTDAYHEDLVFYVVISKGEITDFKVIEHRETEDYGGYIETDWFEKRMQVSVSEPLTVVKLSKTSENEIVAITGATITTQGIVYGVNDCIENYWRYLDEF